MPLLKRTSIYHLSFPKFISRKHNMLDTVLKNRTYFDLINNKTRSSLCCFHMNIMHQLNFSRWKSLGVLFQVFLDLMRILSLATSLADRAKLSTVVNPTIVKNHPTSTDDVIHLYCHSINIAFPSSRRGSSLWNQKSSIFSLRTFRSSKKGELYMFLVPQ